MTTRPTLALAMIVRDAAGELPECLGSVRGVVDEIVVGDTGSHDGSAEIARHLGARVIPVPWTNHFAEARNRVLDAVSSDWVLVLDADERIDPTTREQIHSHLNTDCDGYQVNIRNYVDRLDARLWDHPAVPNDGLLPESSRFPAWLGHQNVRLFRRLPAIRFSGRVHESVGPSLIEHRHRLGQAGFVIHHLGFVLSAEAERRKHELYQQLGKQKLQEMPDNAQAHFEVGLEELTRGSGAGAALGYFVQACRLNPRFALGWVFGGIALSMLGHYVQSEEFLGQAESLGYRSPLLLELRADLMYRNGDYAAACHHYRQLLTVFSLAPEGMSKLGLALWRNGSAEEGLQHLRHAVRSFPAVAPNYDRLITVLIAQDQVEEAAEVAVGKLKATAPDAENFLRLASLYAKLSRWPEVRETLLAGCRTFPDNIALRNAAEENDVIVPEMKCGEAFMRKD